MYRVIWQRANAWAVSDKIAWVLSVCFALLTAWGARFSIVLPYTPVPVTLQTLFTLLSGMVLGARWGMVAQVQYLLIGFTGFPVFAAGGGIGYLFNPRGTGGYLLALPIAAYVTGWLVERDSRASLWRYLLAGVLGTMFIHLIGASWLALFLHLSTSQAVVLGVLPFLAGDVAKVIAAVFCALGVRRFRN